MPHLIFQTKFPMHEQVAEITFFGCIERETMEALQQTTVSTLQRNATGTQEPVGVWRQSPYSGHVVHFVVNVPGNWQLRHTLQNILRVAWMDIFDKAGWTVMSMWNCNSSASMAGVTPGGASDKAFAVPPPPPHPAETIGGGQRDGPPKKEAGDAAAAAAEAVDDPGAAPSSEAATRSETGAGGGDDGAHSDAAGNKADGGANGHKERATGEVEKFEGECANFLLFKAGTASGVGVGGLISPHVTTLEASLFLGGMSAAHSESAAQQLMLASLPWLGAKAAPVDSGSSFGGASSSACAAMPGGGGATKGKGRAAQNPAAMSPGDGAETEKALRLSGSRSHENPTDELLVAATMAAAAAEREAAGVASSDGGKRKASGTSDGGASGAGDSSRSGSATKKRKDAREGKDRKG